MLLHAPSLPVTNKLYAVMLTMACLCGQAHTGLAQSHKPVVTLGDGIATNATVTKAQILANPVLKCGGQDCEVTSFSISFAPAKENISGPYGTMGARIGGAQLQLLQASTSSNIKIFIEQVHVKKGGKDEVATPLVITCKQ